MTRQVLNTRAWQLSATNELQWPHNMASIGLSRPKPHPASALPKIGQAAPRSSALAATEALRVIAFIRHVGCPFAENTVKQLRSWTDAHPHAAVFIISHGDARATHEWLDTIGGLSRMHLVVDTSRALHAQWGVGYANFWHFGGPASLLGVIALLWKGIRNRSASGTRWQRAALFMTQGEQVVWSHLPRSAQEFELPPEDMAKR